LLDLIKESPAVFAKSFVLNTNEPDVAEIIDSTEAIFSETGSNKFQKEQELFQAYCDFAEFLGNDGEFIFIVCLLLFYRNLNPLSAKPLSEKTLKHDY